MKKISFLSLVMFFLLLSVAYTGQKDGGKIAVASNSKQPTSKVSSLAGRSPCYLIFDDTGKFTEAVKNPYKDEGRGAGSSAANFLFEKGVTVVIAETFGGKMINAIESKDMTYVEFKGNANDAVKKVLNSK